MALFPKIDSPCPYKANLAAVMDGDFCRMCKRNVVDLTAWSDDARVAFLGACETDVCVSYRLPVKAALAAAAMAASVAALPAAAQDTTPAPETAVVQDAVATDEGGYGDDFVIVVGGLTRPKQAQMIERGEAPEDKTLPELPVIYEAPERIKAPAPVKS